MPILNVFLFFASQPVHHAVPTVGGGDRGHRSHVFSGETQQVRGVYLASSYLYMGNLYMGNR